MTSPLKSMWLPRIYTSSIYTFILFIIIVVNVFRFLYLDKVPYGFNIDELGSAVTIQCLVTEGIDARNKPYPLFSDLGGYGSPKPPIYLYPAFAWTKVFGFSIASFRAYTAFFFILGIIGLYFLAKLIGGVRFGLWTMLVASISPWGWMFSRIAYESPFCIPFLIWGVYFFLRSAQWPFAILSAINFAFTVYAYPPMKVFIPLFIPLLIFYSFKIKRLRLNSLALIGVCTLFLLIPMFYLSFNGSLQSRFNEISIFSKDYLSSIGKTNSWIDLTKIFLQNFFAHFSLEFLFISGGKQIIHSTQKFGELSWLDSLSLLTAFGYLVILLIKKFPSSNPWRQDKHLVTFLILAFLLGIVPSALTNTQSGIPNALRMIGSWPFLCLFVGYFLWKVTDRWLMLAPIALLTAVLFISSFLSYYLKVYPQISKGTFSFWSMEQAQKAKTDMDWLNFIANYRSQDLHCRYYLMNYKGETCSSSQRLWKKIGEVLAEKGIH